MIQETVIDGRPATVMFINDDFEPVDEEEATLVRVIFLDERGGSAFLTRAPREADDATAAGGAE